uniref:Sulfotransferase n=1 Tax=Ciona savignyi TaxID=51511 RepID=H2YWZ1_CIOSA
MNYDSLVKALDKIVKEEDIPDFTPLGKVYEEMFPNPEVTEWGSYRCLFGGFDLQLAKWVYENWSPRKDDILVASFMKTGTTWMRRILSILLYKDEPNLLGLCKTLTMPHIYLETGSDWKFANLIDKLPLPRRILGTHLPAELVNLGNLKRVGTKVIYMIRNPKDQAVSLFHFVQNIPVSNSAFADMYPHEWNKFLRSYMTGEQYLGMKPGEWYPDHILSWYKYRNNENVMFVYYEDLIKNFKPTIKRVADFVNVKLSDEDIEQIETATSFNEMKSDAQSAEKLIKMYRKGGIGDWKNHFTVSQSEQMDLQISNKFAETDIDFVYEM